ncbi:MAG TPA: thiamine pyrophosphate-requiring protein, partial [Thermoanaerobaculia bacterium]|nr:thiamine pyrophosphate-requiring protein [Thermoanaerobaculia bacterium]
YPPCVPAPRTVAEAYLAALARRGVDFLFANAGTDFAPVIEALAGAPSSGLGAPRAIAVPHEVVAVGMAHGYWLATGRPQAVMVHVDVGTANALVGVMNAARAHVPLLFTSGRTPFTESGHQGSRDLPIHWGQEMRDQGALVREHVKWEHELVFGDQVETVVDRALAIATSAPPGPVYLSLPRETLAAAWNGAPLASTPTQATPALPHPDPAAIERAASLLAAARRPLVIAAAFNRDASAGLADFAERFALPVVEHWSPCLALATEHPMHAGFDPGDLLAEADVVLVLDAPVPWIPSRHRLAESCAVIQVGPDPTFADLALRGHRSAVAICSGVSSAIAALGRALAELVERSDMNAPGAPSARSSAADELACRIAAGRARDRARAGDLGLPPAPAAARAWISRHLDEALAADLRAGRAWIFNELGCDPSVMRFPRSGALFGLSIAGALGWALPAALGAQLAAPDQIVLATLGDGSYTFANPVACHQMAATLGLPVLAVVFDNQGWQAVRQATLALYPQGDAADAEEMPLTSLAPSPDYAQVIAASGGYGERVDDPSGFPAALHRALQVVRRERRQALVQVRLPLS